MSEVNKDDAKWPEGTGAGGGEKVPVSEALLANAAARAAASGSRKELVEYLRLRRQK